MHDKIILFDVTLLVQKKNMMCAGYIEQSNWPDFGLCLNILSLYLSYFFCLY